MRIRSVASRRAARSTSQLEVITRSAAGLLLGALGSLTLHPACADPIPLKSGDDTPLASQDAAAQSRKSDPVSRCIAQYRPARTPDEAIAISKRCKLDPCSKPKAADDIAIKWGPP